MTGRPPPRLRRVWLRATRELVLAVLAAAFCIAAMHVAAELFGGY